jgi:hypothetical protein
MSTPTLKNFNLECAVPSGTELQLALKSELSPSQTDQEAAEDKRRHGEAETARNAEARINQAATVIRSLSDSRLEDFGRGLSSPANSNVPPSKIADIQPNALDRPNDCEFVEAQPSALYSLNRQTFHEPPPPVPPAKVGPALLRFLIMATLAASVAWAITLLPFQQPASLSPKDARDGATYAEPRQAASERAQLSRLVLTDQHAFANEPLTLGVSVAPATGFGSILIGGLMPGTRLSAGAPVTSGSWELPLDSVGGVRVYPPQNFIGVMDTAVDLLAPSKKIIDRRPERLEWIAKAGPSQRGREIDPEGARSAVTRAIDPRDATALMERGRELLKNGDVALAQLAFRRLADAGSADAALALANTYDPRYLAKHNLIELIGDETKAQIWYRRASQLGSPDADHILAHLDAE